VDLLGCGPLRRIEGKKALLREFHKRRLGGRFGKKNPVGSELFDERSIVIAHAFD
jgi:hypothetical protein